jgi:hypothetical protein
MVVKEEIRKQFLVDVGDESLNEGRGRHLRRRGGSYSKGS